LFPIKPVRYWFHQRVAVGAKYLQQIAQLHCCNYSQCIKELGSRARVEALSSLWRESSSRISFLFGSSGVRMITYSNWTKAKLFDLDFSMAIITPDEKTKKPDLPRYIKINQCGFVLPNSFPIIGKDKRGNYWLSGYMNKGHWRKIEEHADA
jgi:hypothetical protein